MDDAVLHLGLRKNRLYCLREALESVHTGDKDFFHPSALQFCDNLKPELGILVFGSPHAKNLLDTVHIDAYGKVD
jgi:hypothetical protein